MEKTLEAAHSAKNIYVFRYKAHIGVDLESELIWKAAITPARICDSGLLESAPRV